MIRVVCSGAVPRATPEAFLRRTVDRTFRAARRTPAGEIGLRFVRDPDIAKLNRTYLGKRGPTDVLSFPAGTVPGVPRTGERSRGDIVIAPQYAKREAIRRSVPFREEVVRLVAHGTLHLLGFDHRTAAEESRMFRLQERVVHEMM